jgi:hypothetical protein
MRQILLYCVAQLNQFIILNKFTAVKAVKAARNLTYMIEVEHSRDSMPHFSVSNTVCTSKYAYTGATDKSFITTFPISVTKQ